MKWVDQTTLIGIILDEERVSAKELHNLVSNRKLREICGITNSERLLLRDLYTALQFQNEYETIGYLIVSGYRINPQVEEILRKYTASR